MNEKLEKWYKRSSYNFLTKEILLEKYTELEYWSKVAKYFNMHRGTLSKIQKLFNILGYGDKKDWRCPKTTNQNTTQSIINFRKIITKELLLETYNKFKNWRKVANCFQVCQNVVVQARKQLNIYEKTKTTGINYSGEKHPLYMGKYKNQNGYIIVNRYHPDNHRGKQTKEHILVIEKYIGRSLKTEEVIHHIDGDKSNNIIENLYLCNMSTHRKIEAQISKIGYELIKRKIIIFDKNLDCYKLNEGVLNL